MTAWMVSKQTIGPVTQDDFFGPDLERTVTTLYTRSSSVSP